jgi:hypothetical protein
VYDVIEPFRILGERTVVLLFTGRRAKNEYFEEVPGGVGLSKDGKGAFFTSFNERLDKTVRYPVQSKPGKTRNVKQRDVIQFEAHALANQLLGRRDLPRVVETRKLWEDDQPALPDDDADEAGPAEETVLPPGADKGESNVDVGAIRHREGQDADEDRPPVS